MGISTSTPRSAANHQKHKPLKPQHNPHTHSSNTAANFSTTEIITPLTKSLIMGNNKKDSNALCDKMGIPRDAVFTNRYGYLKDARHLKPDCGLKEAKKAEAKYYNEKKK